MQVGDLLMDSDGILAIVVGHHWGAVWVVKWSDLPYTISFDEKEIENGFAEFISKGR